MGKAHAKLRKSGWSVWWRSLRVGEGKPDLQACLSGRGKKMVCKRWCADVSLQMSGRSSGRRCAV